MTDLIGTLGALLAGLGNAQGTALRERIELVKAQATLVTEELRQVKSQLAVALDERAALEAETKRLRLELDSLKQRYAPEANPKGYRCSSCGSGQVRCTGSKPDPVFGDLGAKLMLYRCNLCGAESGFSEDPL